MVTDLEVKRLLAAIYPTRTERVLDRIVLACYRVGGDSGPVSWLGDRTDDLRYKLQHRRAAR